MTKTIFFAMTKKQIFEIVKLVATFIVGVATVLLAESCSASMSILWKNSNQNSSQGVEQKTVQETDSLTINLKK